MTYVSDPTNGPVVFYVRDDAPDAGPTVKTRFGGHRRRLHQLHRVTNKITGKLVQPRPSGSDGVPSPRSATGCFQATTP